MFQRDLHGERVGVLFGQDLSEYSFVGLILRILIHAQHTAVRELVRYSIVLRYTFAQSGSLANND